MKTNKKTYVQPQARVYNIQQNLMDNEVSGGDPQEDPGSEYAKQSNTFVFIFDDQDN